MSFGKIMGGSVAENWYIFFNAVVSAMVCIYTCIFARFVKNKFEAEGGEKLKNATYYALDVGYSIFIALISIFPLLGMFGTVKALLELDLSGEMESLKGNFFNALTSTAWGLIFAVLFKIVNAFIQPFIENQIAKAKTFLKE